MTKLPTISISPGDKYGHWEVIREVERKRTKGGLSLRRVLCRCTACGVTEDVVLFTNLRQGNSTMCKSCGVVRSRGIGRYFWQHQDYVEHYMRTLTDDELGKLVEASTAEFRRRCHG